MASGDRIRIASNIVTITSIPSKTQIVVDHSVTTQPGDMVMFVYAGSAPDLGYWEKELTAITPPLK